MKKICQNTVLVFILVSTLFANAQTFSSVPVWSDDFSGNNILPNATIWNNEIGMIRNAELQYYTDRDIDNQVLVNDELQIIGRRENFGGARYTSASLTSKASWKYGKIEGRIKMQTGMGIWGCFWTLGKNMSWPSCGEIDIIEHINSEAAYHGTAHWWNETLSTADKHEGDGGSFPDPIGTYNANNYNTYSIEWTPSYIKWYLNNNLVKTMSILNGVRGTWEFHAPQYILLNCPIGGSWPQIDAGANWNEALIPVPNTMSVDYVKVYSFNSGAPAAPVTITSSSVTQTSFMVNWTASSGATAYDVVLDKNGTITTYGPFSTTSCTITGLTANTNYAIRVKARNVTTNNSDLSELSNPLYVTTLSSTPPTPIVNLQFNENSGSSTSNAGLAIGSLNLKGTAAWSTNTPANSSIRTSAISIANNDDAVETPFLVDQLKGLNDITITGWLNCKDATETGGNRIASCLGGQWFDGNRGTGGFDLVYKTDGSLQLGINEAVGATSARSSAGKITTDAAAGATNWKFFAVTYSVSSQTASFYFGSTAASATLDKTVPYSKGVIGGDVDPLAIGNFNSITRGWLTGRMFRGLIDQIQIYNSSLNLSQIIAVQNGGIAVTSVAITPATATLASIGATNTLTATVAPANATNKTLTWSSSNTLVATVSQAGIVSAVGQGTAIITATSTDGSNLNGTSSITVTIPSSNLALNKPVIVSTTSGSFSGSLAVDGNNTTRWGSAYADPQWIYVDLGATYDVNRVKISWEYAYAADYLIQVSTDAINWTTIQTIVANTALTFDSTGLTGTGRYVRIYGTKRATVYGYSIFELEVYGTLNTSVTSTYEAENGTLNIAIVKSATNASNGSVVGNFGVLNSFSKISNISGGAGGTAVLKIRYSNGNTSNTSLSYHYYTAAGTPMFGSQVIFPPTGGWNTFAEITMNINLQSGSANMLKFQRLANDVAGPDIDKYTITVLGTNRRKPSTMSNAELKQVLIFPNPAKSKIELSFNGYNGSDAIDVTIYNELGQLVFRQKSSDNNSMIINKQFSDGIYIVKVKDNQNTALTKKLIIKN